MKKVANLNWLIKLLLTFAFMFTTFFLAMPARAAETTNAAVTASSTATASTVASRTSTDQPTGQTSATPQATSAATERSATSSATPSSTPSSASTPSVQSNEQSGSQLSATHIDVSVTVNGQALTDNTKIDKYTPFNVDFRFDFSGQDVRNGDWFEFSLPSALSVSTDHFAITDHTNGSVIANVTIGDNNTGRVVFNDAGSDASGSFNVQMNIDTTKVSENQEVPINISVNGQNKPFGSFTYIPGTVSPDEVFSKYTYNGTLGPDKANPADTNPNFYTPDDITHGNLTYALRINPGAQSGFGNATIGD